MQKEITLSDLKQMMAELVMSQKETKELFKETDRKFNETALESEKSRKELDEIHRRSKKELDKRFAETTKHINQVLGKFDSQWGKLMESLVEGDLVKLFKERNISVHRTTTRIDGNFEGRDYEFDIIAHNGNEVIFVEVKTTLKVNHVKDFIEKLTKVKKWMPDMKVNRIYGAIAFMKSDHQSKTYALKQKLFVIKATGSSSSIVNNMDFQPRYF